MLQKTLELKVETKGQQLINVTDQMRSFVFSSGIKTGILNIAILHTSASLIIQENASEEVLVDLLDFYDKLVPMDGVSYTHSLEGKDDMPAHIKTSLTNTNLTISIINGTVKLGVWQGIFLFEHRSEDHTRSIFTHIIGDMT